MRQALPVELRRFPDFIATRDAYQDVVYRLLPQPGKLRLLEMGRTCWGYTTKGKLLLGAVSPSWHGVRSYYENSPAAELIDDFAHFASQYILRSRIVRIQAALALTYGIACDFRAADIVRLMVGPHMYPSLAAAQAKAPAPDERVKSQSTRARELHAWVGVLNPIDPFIHRALFKFWRACALMNHGFWEEAITALDGVVSVGAEALQMWQLLSSEPSRPNAAALLGMTKDEQRQIEILYKLRCTFGAHPPPSKWWDFSELYDSELDQYPALVRRFLYALCSYEAAHRIVEPEPAAWADWFIQNAEMLLEVSWFTKLPE